jgi:CRISPR/Cas system-associated endoribonuclease Cas2
LYKALKKEIHMVVDDKKDFVLLFHVANKNNMVRECVGREYDPTHNIF